MRRTILAVCVLTLALSSTALARHKRLSMAQGRAAITQAVGGTLLGCYRMERYQIACSDQWAGNPLGLTADADLSEGWLMIATRHQARVTVHFAYMTTAG